MGLYFANVAQRKRNNGYITNESVRVALTSIKHFLRFLDRPITPTVVSDLLDETRQAHKNDDFATDNSLLLFVAEKPHVGHAIYGAIVKGIFKAKRCPLQASFNTTFTHSTRKISTGILKELYDSLSDEQEIIMDWQAYAGERVSCICSNITIDQIELYNERYALIHIEPYQTEARNRHVCIVPRQLAEKIIRIAKTTNRSTPFPNYDTIWRDNQNRPRQIRNQTNEPLPQGEIPLYCSEDTDAGQ